MTFLQTLFEEVRSITTLSLKPRSNFVRIDQSGIERAKYPMSEPEPYACVCSAPKYLKFASWWPFRVRKFLCTVRGVVFISQALKLQTGERASFSMKSFHCVILLPTTTLELTNLSRRGFCGFLFAAVSITSLRFRLAYLVCYFVSWFVLISN